MNREARQWLCSVFILAADLCSPAVATTSFPNCEEPIGHKSADNVIAVELYECNSEAICTVSIRAPLEFEKREILGFRLQSGDGTGGPVAVPYRIDDQGENAIVTFEFPRAILSAITVSVAYRFRAACYLVSTWDADDMLPRITE
jgi:hypothetical protein